MNIVINGKKFPVFLYDDDITILERYSSVDSSKNTIQSLPSFFRITDKDFILAENLKIEVEDVRDYIKELDQIDLLDETTIQDIVSKYPRLRKREIGFLWIMTHPKEDIDIENFKHLDRSSFLSSERAKRSAEEFGKEIQKINEKNKRFEKEEEDMYKIFTKNQSIKTDPFDAEEISIATGVNLPDGEAIVDVFDAMDVSKNIPFIMIVHGRKRFYKIHTHTIPPDQWIEKSAEAEEEGIYFKILNQPTSKLSSKKILVENLYADGFWSPENIIYFTFRVRDKGGEDKIRNMIFETLKDRLKYTVISSRQVGIKGIFLIKDFSIERYIFADLVATNDIFKRFLFFDERGSEQKIKTVLTKLRLFVHYVPSIKEGAIARNNLGITITPILDAGKESLSIRVSGASNLQQANAFANTFSKLLGLYKALAPEIKDIYETIIPKLKESVKMEKKKEIVVDKKTKKRLAALRGVDPDMFRERYGDQCQREGQPVVITKEEADIAVKKFKKMGVPNPAHKVMFFNGHYFICDPREPDDKKAKPHVWPGLKINKPSNKLKGIALENAVEFAEKHPLLPCCYTMDQYTKKASQLRLYMQEHQSADAEEPKKKEAGGGDHILGPNKLTPIGRYGEMPFNWEKIFRYMGLKKTRKGKQEFYPILRHGVAETPDSFVHCLERVFNPEYTSYTQKKRNDKVMKVRKTIAESDSFSIAKQEMFDYTEEAIKDILNDSDRYVDPDLFVSIFQKHYKCNIFLYLVNAENPNGAIVIPRHSQAHLQREINTGIPSVLIIKYEVGKDYPYQCEVVTAMNIKDGKIQNVDFKFEKSSPISEMAIKMFYDSNEVFIVSPDGYKPYKPVSEFL